MNSFRGYAFGAIFTALLGSPAFAAGDSIQGEELATEHCARCHDVSADGVFKQYPPSFASIAAYRSEDQIHARIVFPALHTGMPEVGLYLLGAQGIDDLVAYIMSLEQ